jgi:hypothetical protein
MRIEINYTTSNTFGQIFHFQVLDNNLKGLDFEMSEYIKNELFATILYLRVFLASPITVNSVTGHSTRLPHEYRLEGALIMTGMITCLPQRDFKKNSIQKNFFIIFLNPLLSIFFPS